MEAKGQLYHAGAHLEALFIGACFEVVSHAGLKFRLHFFRILTSALEQCEMRRGSRGLMLIAQFVQPTKKVSIFSL